MLSYISDLKMKEKGRRLFCSLKCGLICCFMASLSVLVIALVFDSVDGIGNLYPICFCIGIRVVVFFCHSLPVSIFPAGKIRTELE